MVILSIIIFSIVLSIVLFGGGANITVREQEIKKEASLWAETLDPAAGHFSHYPNVQTNEKELKEIYSMGFASVPFMLDYIEIEGMNNTNKALIISAATYNLHLPYMVGSITVENPEVSKDENAYTPRWYAKQLKEYAKSIPNLVDTICNSDDSFENKCAELDKLGMLAIPFLVDKIEKGENKWEICIRTQTLGMNSEKRFQKLFTEKEYPLDYEIKRSMIQSDFSVQDWIIENNDDTSILKDFCS